MSYRLHVIFNGSSSAFMRYMGCSCARCSLPVLNDAFGAESVSDARALALMAHTSASLVIEDEQGDVVDHTVVDCGNNVANNLIAIPTPAQHQPISRVLLTHGHLDHMIGLDPLIYPIAVGLKSGCLDASRQPWPLPVYTTSQTWMKTIGNNPADPMNSGHLKHLLHRMTHIDMTDAAYMLSPITLHPALTVTPVPVEHFLDSVHYLFEFWPSGHVGDGKSVKIAICWDLMAYPDGRPGDVWQGKRLHPQTDPLLSLFSNVDLLAIEMTSWHPKPIGHIAFMDSMLMRQRELVGYGIRHILDWWRPKSTSIVHYSGHEDIPKQTSMETIRANHDPAYGPVSDTDLRLALQQAAGELTSINVAQPGQTTTFG